jgi:hypothetical protein
MKIEAEQPAETPYSPPRFPPSRSLFASLPLHFWLAKMEKHMLK